MFNELLELLPNMAHTTKTARKRVVAEQENEIMQFRMDPFRAQTNAQKALHHACRNSPLVFAVGPAGTGKSYVGASAALQLYQEHKIDKIILTRNPLPTGTSLGFFAGSEREKMAVWLGPILGTMKKILKTRSGTDGMFNYMVAKGYIDFQPLEVIKGSSFDRSFIIVEEAQELSMEQLKTLTTRIGEDSHLFLNGDFKQSNARNRSEKGFREFVDMVLAENEHTATVEDENSWDAINIPVIGFKAEDIVRSGICRKVVTMFDKFNI